MIDPGDVVLVPFPYRDQLAESTRPAVVVSATSYNQATGDIVLAGITSHPPRGVFDYSLVDWQAAGLQYPSTVRMLMMTVAQSRIIRTIGRLSNSDWMEVQARLARVFT